VRLAPMTTEDAVGLVMQVHGVMRPDQLEAILARGGGNPYFLMQLAATEDGAELPDTVEELVGARIDALDADERELLRRSAVLGSRFRDELYQVVTGDLSLREAGTPALREFLDSTADGQVVFQREIYREVAYGQLTFRSRRQLHRQAALAIEGHPALAGEARLSMLSLHYDRAGLWEEAWRASRAAGDEAREAAAHDQAVEFYRRALNAGRRSHIDNQDLQVVTESMGDAAHVAGRFDEAIDAYRRVLRTVADPAHRVRVELKTGRVLDQDAQFQRASRIYRDARQATQRLSAEVRAVTAGEIDVADSASQYYRGNNELARELAGRAWDTAETLSGDERSLRLRARAAFLYDSAAGLLEGPAGLRFHDLPLRIYRELGDHYYAGITCNNLGSQAFHEGRWDDAASLYLAGRDSCLRAGDRMTATFNEMNLAEVLGLQGKVAESEELLESALQTFRSMRVQVGIAATGAILAALLLRTGQLDRAIEALAGAREVSTAINSQQDLDECEVLDLEALLLAERYADLLPAGEALLARRPPVEPLRKARTRRILGLGLLRSGDFGNARVQLEAALLLARQMESDYDIALTLAAQAELGGPEAEFELEDAGSLFAKLGIVRLD